MPLLRPTHLDDRGSRVRLLARHLAKPSRFDRERRARIARAHRPREDEATWREVAKLVGAGFFLFLILIGASHTLVVATRQSHWPTWLIPALGGLIGGLLGLASMHYTHRLLGPKRARRAVRAGYCGSCGYDLSNTPPEADTCRVCPECGAAWKQP